MIDFDRLWPEIQKINIAEEEILPPKDLFRFRLADFVHRWQDFSARDIPQKIDKLSRVFNRDYFDEYTVVTDSLSLQKLINTPFKASCEEDGTGFIYIYSFEDSISAWSYEEGIPFCRDYGYRPKIKIGKTERHPYNRISEQFGQRTNIPEPPVLLAILWANLVSPCEEAIHQELVEQGKRLKDKSGNNAQGGKEWFKDNPTQTLIVINKWVSEFRTSQILQTEEQIRSWEDLVGYFKKSLSKLIGIDKDQKTNKSARKPKIFVENIYVYPKLTTIKALGISVGIPSPEIQSIKVSAKDHVILNLKDGRYVLDFSGQDFYKFSSFLYTLDSKMTILTQNRDVITYILKKELVEDKNEYSVDTL